MADILCLAGLAAAVIGILLTVIFCLFGKKAAVPLVLLGLGVAVVLGSGLLPAEEPEPAETEWDDMYTVPLEVPGGVPAADREPVDVTLPAFLFQEEDMSAFDGGAYAQQMGFSRAVLNDDGSVTVTMTRGRRQELLDELSVQLDQMILEIVDSEETPYIRSITHAVDFSEITVEVDRATYENTFLDLTPLALGLSGMMYQSFADTALHVGVSVKDADTGETIYFVAYPDIWEALPEN